MFVPVPYSSDFEYICTYCTDSIYDVLFLCSTCVKFILCKQCVVHGVELGDHKNTHGLKPIDLGNYVLFDLSGVPQRQWKVRFAECNTEQPPEHRPKPKAHKSKLDSPTGNREPKLKSILKVRLSAEEQRRQTINNAQIKYHNIFLTICRRKSNKTPDEFDKLVNKLNGYVSMCRAKHIEKVEEKKQKVREAIQKNESPEVIASLKRSNKFIFKIPDVPNSRMMDLNDIRRSSRAKLSPRSKDISPTRSLISKSKELKVKIRQRQNVSHELSCCIVVEKKDIEFLGDNDSESDEQSDEDLKMDVEHVSKKRKITLEKRVTRSKKTTKSGKQAKKSAKKRKHSDGRESPRNVINSKQKNEVKSRLILLKNRATELKRRMNKTKNSLNKNKLSFVKVLRSKIFVDPKVIQDDLAEVEKDLQSKNVLLVDGVNSYKNLQRKRYRRILERRQRLPKNCTILSPVNKQWQAWEEMQLLDAIEKYGYGNWKAIADEMQDEVCITPKAVAEHYFIHYVLYDVGDCTLKWKRHAHTIRKMLDRQSMFKQRVPDLSGLIADAEHNFKFNYKPKRDDFEPDIDSDFESVVANMLPDTENVTVLDMKLQVAHMEMYKLIIRDRQYSKYIIREYELLRKFIFQYPRKKLKVIESEQNSDIGAFRVFLRFASREHLQKLYLSLHKEFFLKLIIRILLRFKNLGIVTLDQLVEYKRRRNFGDRDLFSVGENELLSQDFETLRTILELESSDEQELYIEEILPYLLGKIDGEFFNKLPAEEPTVVNGRSPKKVKLNVEDRIEQWISFAGDIKKKVVDHQVNVLGSGKLANSITKQEMALCADNQCSASKLLDLKTSILNEFQHCVEATNLKDNIEKRSQRQVELLCSLSGDISAFLSHIENLQLNSDV